MNPIELLKHDHRELEQCLNQVGQAKNDAERQQQLEKFHKLLEVHDALEMQAFYPACQREQVDSELINDFKNVHQEAMRLTIRLKDLSGGEWQDTFSQMKHSVLNHIQQEEHELFPDVQQQLSPEVMDQLGSQMKQLHDRQAQALGIQS
jgi:hemerythrin superfamily protein